MASEASWQASSAGELGGSDISPVEAPADQQSVESLIRRLMQRVEESERRYSEALEDLHARLDQLTQTTEALPTSGTSEETETLERLRKHLSSLTDRLEPKESEPGFSEFAKIDRALAEAREATASLNPEPAPSAPPPSPPSFAAPGAATTFGLALPAPEQKRAAASPFAAQPSAGEPADIDKRLIDMANRLERSIGETNARSAIETLNLRMDELAKRFEAALSQGPGNANLKALEQQITAVGQQVGRVEQQLQRIGVVETELNRLMQRFEGTPAQLAEAASRAANEAARLVAENGAGSLSAVERLDAIHRDLVAMNERSRATDDRVVDTLAAVHESLKGLVYQLERGNKTPPAPATRQAAAPSPDKPEGSARGGFTLPPQRPGMPPFAPEGRGAGGALLDKGEEDLRSEEPRAAEPPAGDRSLRNRLRTTFSELEEGAEQPQAAFGHAKRAVLHDQDFEADEAEPRPFARSFDPDTQRDTIEDLVAAARRASQAAAARAEERGAPAARPARGTKEAPASIGIEVPERRSRPVLMIAAALLLVISAALLYSRLRSKPEAETIPPAVEQTAPAPAPEAAPAEQQAAPEASAPETESASPPVTTDVVPELPPSPEPAPAPNTTPDLNTAPGATDPMTPSAFPGDATLPPPMRMSDTPVVVGAASVPATAGGVTDIIKSAAAEFAPETSLKPQPVSLRSDAAPALPAGVAVLEGPAQVAPPQLPLPDAEIGPIALREAAASGDARAEYIVGIRYAQGQGSAGTPNWTEAARWLALAASAGLAPAQYRLAVLYERGDGVAKDLGTAKSWYSRAAEQGNVKAMHNLAVAVSRESTSADYALAAKWYAEAASYGLADSQFNLGVLTEHGLGVEKDLAAAYRWFSLAAQSRDAEAIKRRDSLKAALSIVGTAEAEAAIKAWKAKPAKPEANQVPELDAWRVASSVPNKDVIAQAQNLLNQLGYQVGPADGDAGARTREAIKTFELRNGMDQTGEVTAPLLKKLQQLAG